MSAKAVAALALVACLALPGAAGAAGPVDTIIIKKPSTNKPNKTIVHFQLVDSDGVVAGAQFFCRLDGPWLRGSYRPCADPIVRRHLRAGDYEFRVYGVAPDGRADPVAASLKFHVLSRSGVRVVRIGRGGVAIITVDFHRHRHRNR